jgi:hypothetical protein
MYPSSIAVALRIDPAWTKFSSKFPWLLERFGRNVVPFVPRSHVPILLPQPFQLPFFSSAFPWLFWEVDWNQLTDPPLLLPFVSLLFLPAETGDWDAFEPATPYHTRETSDTSLGFDCVAFWWDPG